MLKELRKILYITLSTFFACLTSETIKQQQQLAQPNAQVEKAIFVSPPIGIAQPPANTLPTDLKPQPAILIDPKAEPTMRVALPDPQQLYTDLKRDLTNVITRINALEKQIEIILREIKK